jgi:hypothetical protein
VIQASAARKVGRDFLDWVNAGAPGFADGGNVIGSSTGGVLGPGDHDVTYDPQSAAPISTAIFIFPAIRC